MPTTPRRVLARLLITPLCSTLVLSVPSTPARATVAPAPNAESSAVEHPTVLTAERFRERRAVQQVRKVRRLERLARLREQREQREERLADRGRLVVAAAAAQAGVPYVYGGTGPGGFDCSGLTGWAYRSVGIELPRTSSAQAAAAQPVSDPRPGDLVFFGGSGGVYHVGIYAGDGQVWHSPRPGSVVHKAPIWTSSVFYGRCS